MLNWVINVKKNKLKGLIVALFAIFLSGTSYYVYKTDFAKSSQVSSVNKNELGNTQKIVLGEDKKNNQVTPNTSTTNEVKPEDSGNVNQVNTNTAITDEPKPEESKPDNPKIIEDKPLYPKEVFLTIDDGPSANTLKILKILDDNNVKATFFVIGKNVEAHPELVKAEYNDGMSVQNHSYTHDYAMYKSVESTLDEFSKCSNSIKNAIGIDGNRFIRFPGGSDNTVSNAQTMKNIRNAVVDKGMEYIDWNVSSGDGASGVVPVDTIKNNLISQFSNRSFAVALCHDVQSKITTVEALPTVIDYLKKQGYVFRTFNDLTPTEEKEMIKQRIINRGYGK